VPESFEDLPVLAALGEQVRVAAERAEHDRVRSGPRWTPRLLAILVALIVPAAVGSAGATYFALRAAVIPASSSTPPEQRPAPGTTRLSGAIVADPRRGQPRWTVRLASSRTGLACSTVGQLVGGRFGIVGLDGRFRPLEPDVADACSTMQRNAATLVGARTFDADQSADVRTIVSGVGGATLHAVTVEAAGRRQKAPVRAGGVFALALQGLPEDLGLRVALTFADGHIERHGFGVGPLVFPDPDGGSAWRVSIGVLGGRPGTAPDPRSCVSLRPARQGPDPAASPPACGRLGGTARRPTGAYFDIRRLTAASVGNGAAGIFGPGTWRNQAPRLLVWGATGRDVVSVRARSRNGSPVTGTWFRPNGAFAFMLGPAARVGHVVLEVRYRNGRVVRATRASGLVAPPGENRTAP